MSLLRIASTRFVSDLLSPERPIAENKELNRTLRILLMKEKHSVGRGMLPRQYSVCICAVGINKHRTGEREKGFALGVCV